MHCSALGCSRTLRVSAARFSLSPSPSPSSISSLQLSVLCPPPSFLSLSLFLSFTLLASILLASPFLFLPYLAPMPPSADSAFNLSCCPLPSPPPTVCVRPSRLHPLASSLFFHLPPHPRMPDHFVRLTKLSLIAIETQTKHTESARLLHENSYTRSVARFRASSQLRLHGLHAAARVWLAALVAQSFRSRRAVAVPQTGSMVRCTAKSCPLVVGLSSLV
eukprot:6183999-Pleurochrysis_carterae.AAC.1